MNGKAAALATAVAAAAAAGGCGGPAPRTSARVDVFNATGAGAPPRPTSITVSWLDRYGFLFQDRLFPVDPGSGSYLGNLQIGIYVADEGPRRAIVRGEVGGPPISEGWGVSDGVAGQPPPPISITLQALPAGQPDPNDVDLDAVPDAVDNCPSVTNPQQNPNDC